MITIYLRGSFPVRVRRPPGLDRLLDSHFPQDDRRREPAASDSRSGGPGVGTPRKRYRPRPMEGERGRMERSGL